MLWPNLVAGSRLLSTRQSCVISNETEMSNKLLFRKIRSKILLYQPKTVGICILSALHAANWLTPLLAQRPGFDKIRVNVIAYLWMCVETSTKWERETYTHSYIGYVSCDLLCNLQNLIKLCRNLFTLYI